MFIHIYIYICRLYKLYIYIYYIQYLKVEVDVQIHMCTQYISISMHITICGSYLQIHVSHLNISMAHKRALPKHGTYLVRYPVYNPHRQLLYPYVRYFTTQPPHTITPFLGFMKHVKLFSTSLKQMGDVMSHWPILDGEIPQTCVD